MFKQIEALVGEEGLPQGDWRRLRVFCVAVVLAAVGASLFVLSALAGYSIMGALARVFG